MAQKTIYEPVPLRTDSFGVMYVGQTRVPLDTVVYAFEQGSSAQQIAEDFPVLNSADVHVAIGYYLRHRAEVAEYLRRREASRAEVRRQNEARCNPVGIRERLLARRKGHQGAAAC